MSKKRVHIQPEQVIGCGVVFDEEGLQVGEDGVHGCLWSLQENVGNPAQHGKAKNTAQDDET
jgi:hypothetical protein